MNILSELEPITMKHDYLWEPINMKPITLSLSQLKLGSCNPIDTPIYYRCQSDFIVQNTKIVITLLAS